LSTEKEIIQHFLRPLSQRRSSSRTFSKGTYYQDHLQILTHEEAQSRENIVKNIELLIRKMDFPEFKFFSQLPTEIRLNIWHYACCIPPVIDLWVRLLGRADSSMFSGTVRYGPFHYTTHTRCHILSANKEARMVEIRHYSLEFGTTWIGEEGPAIVTATAEPRIYINWTYDIICPLPSIWYDRDFQRSDRNNYNELMKDDLYAGYHAASTKFSFLLGLPST
jgi:hypothetical protein